MLTVVVKDIKDITILKDNKRHSVMSFRKLKDISKIKENMWINMLFMFIKDKIYVRYV